MTYSALNRRSIMASCKYCGGSGMLRPPFPPYGGSTWSLPASVVFCPDCYTRIRKVVDASGGSPTDLELASPDRVTALGDAYLDIMTYVLNSPLSHPDANSVIIMLGIRGLAQKGSEKAHHFLTETAKDKVGSGYPSSKDLVEIAKSYVTGKRGEAEVNQKVLPDTIKFYCPYCGRETNIKKSLQPVGKKTKCKGCGKIYELIMEGFKYREVNPQGYQEYTHIQTSLVFVLIPSGTFRMGSPSNEKDRKTNEGPVHEVKLDSYLIAKYELTQEAWTKVMGTSPWSGKNYTRDDPQCAATYISWDDCRNFCEKTGLQLPTEAQWERACRADTSTRFYWGDDLSEGEIGEYAWYNKNTYYIGVGEEYAHRVGQKIPNGFGLYDMSGNVWEWCQDWYGENYYSNSPTSNPTGPNSGSDRVLRGGGWFSDARDCRSAHRSRYVPGNRPLGVRLAASFK